MKNEDERLNMRIKAGLKQLITNDSNTSAQIFNRDWYSSTWIPIDSAESEYE